MTQPDISEERGLLVCPWCGKPEEVFENLYDSEDDETVKCWTVVHQCPVTKGAIVVLRETKAEAIAAWNTRAPPAPSVGVEELRELSEKATAGEWSVERDFVRAVGVRDVAFCGSSNGQHDAAFIAAAVNFARAALQSGEVGNG